MTYEQVELGRFISRPNRFLAKVEVGGTLHDCHVKNTSRLQELLVPGVPAAVQRAQNPLRKTAYSLLAVQHNSHWVNIDSQAPNHVFAEWLAAGHLGPLTLMRPEVKYATSRFDFYLEGAGFTLFAEVKGVTLVEGGIARFPGAPTTRGVKHLQELRQCLADGHRAVAAFVVQRSDVRRLAPNDAMQPAFGNALRKAAQSGVQVVAFNCRVTPNSLTPAKSVEVLL